MFNDKKRKEAVDKLLVKLRSSNLPDETILFMLQSTHFHTPLYLLLLLILLPLKYAWVILVFGILILSSFVYFNGCVLTALEKQLSKKTDSIEKIVYMTVVDPIILLCKDEVTKENRNLYSGIVMIGWLVALFIIYYVRC